MYYTSFMFTQDPPKELKQKYDDMSCVTVVTGTTGTTFYTQNTRFNIPE